MPENPYNKLLFDYIDGFKFFLFFGFKFWVILSFFKRGQLRGARHSAVVLIAPDQWVYRSELRIAWPMSLPTIFKNVGICLKTSRIQLTSVACNYCKLHRPATWYLWVFRGGNENWITVLYCYGFRSKSLKCMYYLAFQHLDIMPISLVHTCPKRELWRN